MLSQEKTDFVFQSAAKWLNPCWIWHKLLNPSNMIRTPPPWNQSPSEVCWFFKKSQRINLAQMLISARTVILEASKLDAKGKGPPGNHDFLAIMVFVSWEGQTLNLQWPLLYGRGRCWPFSHQQVIRRKLCLGRFALQTCEGNRHCVWYSEPISQTRGKTACI